MIDSTGKVIAKPGDFDGIGDDGIPQGLLFPASPAFSPDGRTLYVSNLALDLRAWRPAPQRPRRSIRNGPIRSSATRSPRSKPISSRSAGEELNESLAARASRRLRTARRYLRNQKLTDVRAPTQYRSNAARAPTDLASRAAEDRRGRRHSACGTGPRSGALEAPRPRRRQSPQRHPDRTAQSARRAHRLCDSRHSTPARRSPSRRCREAATWAGPTIWWALTRRSTTNS